MLKGICFGMVFFYSFLFAQEDTTRGTKPFSTDKFDLKVKDYFQKNPYKRSDTSIYVSFSPATAINVYAEDNVWPGISSDVRVGGDLKVFAKESLSLDLYCGYQFSLYFPPEGRLPYFLYKNGMISFQKFSVGTAVRIWKDAFAERKIPFYFSLGQQLSFPFDMRIFDNFFSKRLGDFSLPYYSFKLGVGYVFPFINKKLKPFFQEFELLLSPRNTGAHCELRFCVGAIVNP